VIVLNARGVARLLVRPWQDTANYGFWVIGWTVILAAVWGHSLEIFISTGENSWNTTNTHTIFSAAAWMNLLGWAATTFVILLFVTPTLINKSPKKLMPDFQPLYVWFLLGVLSATGALVHHLWEGVFLITGQVLLVGAIAWHGGAKRGFPSR
jgi:hypothetical protein